MQYAANGSNCDVRLQSNPAKTRCAIFEATNNIELPSGIRKEDIVSSFSETFQVILQGTPVCMGASAYQAHEIEADALNSAFGKLRDRQIVQRVSDRATMSSLSQLSNSINMLDDRSGQTRAERQTLYVVKCEEVQIWRLGESRSSSPVSPWFYCWASRPMKQSAVGQASIQLWYLGSNPPELVQTIQTRNICVLAAVTQVNLAYIVKTPDQ